MLLIILLITLSSLFAFAPVFNLGIFGDDLQAIMRYFQYLGPHSNGHWNYLTFFFTTYGPDFMGAGLHYRLFGFQGLYYHLTSFIFRLIASFSIFWLLRYLTKSNLSGLFAGLFFAVTSVGLDATMWVFNMPSFISIALFNLLLYFYFRSRIEQNSKLQILTYLLFFLAFSAQPIRMAGLLPFMFILELFWWLQDRSFKKAREAAINLLPFVLVFAFIYFINLSRTPFGLPSLTFNTQGVEAGQTNFALKSIKEGRLDLFLYPALTLGGMIVPDVISRNFTGQISTVKELLTTSFGFLLLITFILLILRLFITRINKGFFIRFFSLSGLWIILMVIIYQQNKTIISDFNHILQLNIGGYWLVFIITLLCALSKQKVIFTALFVGLTWTLLSFLPSWIWGMEHFFPTTHRYLIVSADGMALIFGLIIALGSNAKKQLILFVFLLPIIILNIISTRTYINQNLATHSQVITDKIWSAIPYNPSVGKSQEPIVYYFEGDGTNSLIISDTISFGFPSHMAILYDQPNEDYLPSSATDWDTLVSAVTTGKPYRSDNHSIPVDRIYAFKLEGKDQLIDITNSTRTKLKAVQEER